MHFFRQPISRYKAVAIHHNYIGNNRTFGIFVFVKVWFLFSREKGEAGDCCCSVVCVKRTNERTRVGKIHKRQKISELEISFGPDDAVGVDWGISC